MAEKKSYEELQKIYADSLHGQVLDVEQQWQYYKSHPTDINSLNKLLSACHKIAGTGSSFGFPVCSESAREIENTLRKMQDNKKDLSTAIRIDIGKHLNELRKAASNKYR